jgi:hypothetical protein
MFPAFYDPQRWLADGFIVSRIAIDLSLCFLILKSKCWILLQV